MSGVTKMVGYGMGRNHNSKTYIDIHRGEGKYDK